MHQFASPKQGLAPADSSAAPLAQSSSQVRAPSFARAHSHGHRFSPSSAPIQQVKYDPKSKFASHKRRRGHIYTIRDKGSGKVVYVGQTDQKPSARWNQHLKSKPWLSKATHSFHVRRSGKWTPFKMTAYEQYYIKKYGGVPKLRNKINAMTPAKYKLYKGHHKSKLHRKPY